MMCLLPHCTLDPDHDGDHEVSLPEFSCMAWFDYVEIDHDVERDGLVSQHSAVRAQCDLPAGHDSDHSGESVGLKPGRVTWSRRS